MNPVPDMPDPLDSVKDAPTTLESIKEASGQDPLELVRAFQHHVNHKVSPEALLGWLLILKERNREFTLENLADIRDEKTLAALQAGAGLVEGQRAEHKTPNPVEEQKAGQPKQEAAHRVGQDTHNIRVQQMQEFLKGTGISFTIDSMGRELYYLNGRYLSPEEMFSTVRAQRTGQLAQQQAEARTRLRRELGISSAQTRQRKANWPEFERIVTTNRITRLYHFTDRANLISIWEYVGLYSWQYCERNRIKIPRPGGNDLSRQLDLRKGLEDYVRLAFNCRPPMLSKAIQEGRIINPVILEVDPSVIYWETTWFSNINATDDIAVYGGELEKFKSIKFGIATQVYGDGEELKLRQAEVLVKTHIPLDLILYIPRPEGSTLV